MCHNVSGRWHVLEQLWDESAVSTCTSMQHVFKTLLQIPTCPLLASHIVLIVVSLQSYISCLTFALHDSALAQSSLSPLSTLGMFISLWSLIMV